MELFDIIELRSYVTPLAERLRIADAQKREQASAILPAEPVAIPKIRRNWAAASRDTTSPDLILSASDATTFQVHQSRLLSVSRNGFNGKLSPLHPGDTIIKTEMQIDIPILCLPYSSAVVNIFLHVVYEKEGCLRDETPSVLDISSTMRALKECGIPIQIPASGRSLLFSMLSSHCQRSPVGALEVYTLAATHAPDLHHLAVYASRYLISLDFSRITDEIARTMGSIYLLRLSKFLTGRTQEFKRLLLPPPQMHEPVPQCNTRVLREAWTLMTAFLMWYAAPDVKDVTIDGLKASVIDRIRCRRCNEMFERRFETLKQSWASVQCTI